MASAMGEGEGSSRGWVRVESKRSMSKRDRSLTSLEMEGGRAVKMSRAVEEHRVQFKLKDQLAGGFRAMNPLKVAESLKCGGEGIDARILPNGALSVTCKNVDQLVLAKKIGKIGGKRVAVVVQEKKK